MRLFELRVDGEKERIGAKNPIEALKYYLDLTNSDLEWVDDIIEIPKEEWKNIVVKNSEMRNPSKNTIKKIMKPSNGKPCGYGMGYTNYFLFNEVGAQLYRMSKGKLCNREPKGCEKYSYLR